MSGDESRLPPDVRVALEETVSKAKLEAAERLIGNRGHVGRTSDEIETMHARDYAGDKEVDQQGVAHVKNEHFKSTAPLKDQIYMQSVRPGGVIDQAKDTVVKAVLRDKDDFCDIDKEDLPSRYDLKTEGRNLERTAISNPPQKGITGGAASWLGNAISGRVGNPLGIREEMATSERVRDHDLKGMEHLHDKVVGDAQEAICGDKDMTNLTVVVIQPPPAEPVSPPHKEPPAVKPRPPAPKPELKADEPAQPSAQVDPMVQQINVDCSNSVGSCNGMSATPQQIASAQAAAIKDSPGANIGQLDAPQQTSAYSYDNDPNCKEKLRSRVADKPNGKRSYTCKEGGR